MSAALLNLTQSVAGAQAADVASLVDALMVTAREQNDTLVLSAKGLAAEIIRANVPAALCDAVFMRVRGPYVVAKKGGDKRTSTSIGSAWNRVRAALAHHLKEADLVIGWPDIRKGGACTVESAEERKNRRAAEKAEQDASDAEAERAFRAEQAEAELTALRAISPADLAVQIQTMLAAWSDSHSDQADVVRMLAENTFVSKAHRDDCTDAAVNRLLAEGILKSGADRAKVRKALKNEYPELKAADMKAAA